MAFQVRKHVPGGAYFYSVGLADRGSDLLTREIDLLRWCVGKTRGEHPFDVLAWSVLPDHMVCVWRFPTADCDSMQRWTLIRDRFAQGVARAGLVQAQGLWDRRFRDHHIQDAADLGECIEFCRIAPVRAGLAAQTDTWPFSSFYQPDCAVAEAG